METGASTSVDRRADPEQWHHAADSNQPLTTQWDDGAHSGSAPGKVPTSSASAPSVVAAMLHDLHAVPGMRVLEIGTGTGWNAALLAHRLGPQAVTTIEVDPAVAATAHAALQRAGLAVTLVVGDGLHGHPPHAPYDRIIATMGLRAIPYAWVRQTTPGGAILAPWGTHYSHNDAVVRLVVSDNGSASGHFTRPVQFMKARAHRLTRTPHAQYVPGGLASATNHVSTTTLRVADLQNPAFVFAAGLLMGHDCVSVHDQRGNAHALWLYGISDRSFAAAVLHDEHAEATVYEGGPRRLWVQLEAAHRWWVGAGRPAVDRFGLTVTPSGDQPWLDNPHHLLPEASYSGG